MAVEQGNVVDLLQPELLKPSPHYRFLDIWFSDIATTSRRETIQRLKSK